MAGDIWVSSDPHFRHKNILKFTHREGGERIRPQFETIEEMDEYILQMHNETVKPGDKWYCLGDVMMGEKEGFAAFFAKLHGSKRLIPGNHDDIKWLAAGGFFQKIQLWRVFREHGLVFTHVPVHASSLLRPMENDDQEVINVHGHIHQNKSPVGPYVNLSMEAIDYKPVHLEEIRNLWKKQQNEHWDILSKTS